MQENTQVKNLATINTITEEGIDFRPFLELMARRNKRALLNILANFHDHYVIPAILPGDDKPCDLMIYGHDNFVIFLKNMIIELLLIL